MSSNFTCVRVTCVRHVISSDEIFILIWPKWPKLIINKITSHALQLKNYFQSHFMCLARLTRLDSLLENMLLLTYFSNISKYMLVTTDVQHFLNFNKTFRHTTKYIGKYVGEMKKININTKYIHFIFDKLFDILVFL